MPAEDGFVFFSSVATVARWWTSDSPPSGYGGYILGSCFSVFHSSFGRLNSRSNTGIRDGHRVGLCRQAKNPRRATEENDEHRVQRH